MVIRKNKIIKYIQMIAIVGSICFCFSGCKKEASVEPEQTQAQTAAVEIKENTTILQGTILVGICVNDTPFINETDEKTLEGLEIDIANEIGNLTLSDVKFIEMDKNSRYAELDVSSFDCILSAVMVTEETDKVYDFSIPYLTDDTGNQFAFLVKSGNNKLLNVLNKSISIMQNEGKLEELTNKWLYAEENEQIEK